MSTRLYISKQTYDGLAKDQQELVYKCSHELPYHHLSRSGYRDLEKVVPCYEIKYVTVRETFWKDSDGRTFLPGVYEGRDFQVEITPPCRNNRGGSEKNPKWDESQEIFGHFDTIEVAKAFWQALTKGEILPTRPLCRELTLTEQAYAMKAAAGVTAIAQIGRLEALIAQLTNQVKSQGQTLQNLLTPDAATPVK
jgi:hypothetical protein